MLPDLRRKPKKVEQRKSSIPRAFKWAGYVIIATLFPSAALALAIGSLGLAVFISMLGLFVLSFQIEFTYSWTRALFRIYRALRLSTNNEFRGSTLEALTAGILVSPIIPLALIVFALSKFGDPTSGGPFNVVQPLLVLVMLLVAGNGISLAAALMNYRVLKRLTQWSDTHDTSEEAQPVPVLVPLTLVLPAWLLMWIFPHPACLLYLIATPLCNIYSMRTLSRINERLRKILESAGPVKLEDSGQDLKRR